MLVIIIIMVLSQVNKRQINYHCSPLYYNIYFSYPWKFYVFRKFKTENINMSNDDFNEHFLTVMSGPAQMFKYT